MHGKFVHRLAVRAIGCSILRYQQDVDNAVIFRNENCKNYNWGGSWRRKPVSSDDVTLLKMIKQQLDYEESTVRLKDHEDFKIRIEEPDVQFYATNIQTLKAIADSLRYKDNSHFVSVMTPANQDHENILLEGYTLRKTKINWLYRVIFRDGKYSLETKGQIKSYLNNLGSQIKVPKNLMEQLSKGTWIWGGYIYTNDKSLATMLSLIDGRLISKIEEFKVVPECE